MKYRQAGWSLIELMIAISFLLVGLMSLILGYHNAFRLDENARDQHLMKLACNNMIAEAQAVPLSTVTTQFGSGSGKENFWCGQDDRICFADPGNALATGQITFFTNESAMPLSWSGFSGGLDLNGNGIIDSGSVTDYRILPTRITITANRPDGVRTFTTDFILIQPSSF